MLNAELQYWGLENYKVPGDQEKKLYEEFERIPKNTHQNIIDKWKELGPFHLR